MVKRDSTINIAVVGLGFGREFLPIYLADTRVDRVGVCDQDGALVDHVSAQFGIPDRFRSIEEVLAEDWVDAVHVATPVGTHANYSVATLLRGMHCATAVPIASSLAEVDAVIDAQDKSDKVYMMMETAVFSREYLFVKQLHDEGKLGALCLLRGAHIQDLQGYPEWWLGFPPMHYVTHVLAPLLALTEDRVDTTFCLGSGRLPAGVSSSYGNPYPAEIALFHLSEHHLIAEVTRASFGFARSYQEGFSVYGEKMGFEWGQLEHERPLLFEFLPPAKGRRGRMLRETRVAVPDRADLLPEPIAAFTQPLSFSPPRGSLGAVELGGGHGGSHPHLVNEFLSAIVENRPSSVDARVAAAWTAPGICAHASAMAGGQQIAVRDYRSTASTGGRGDALRRVDET